MYAAVPGSFKDPTSRVYRGNDNILRALNRRGAEIYETLEKQSFFAEWLEGGKIIPTERAVGADSAQLVADGWALVLQHRRIPFISYPYEWPFSMLKDAALLHLELLIQAADAGWTLKDATPYNIQWFGTRPLLIDIPSLEPRATGAPWLGYRQFCMTFLFPLMLKAHLNIDYASLLRGELDGISAAEIMHYFCGRHIFKKGVLPHVIFPAFAEAAARKRQMSPSRRQSDTLVLGLMHGVQNTVARLSCPTTRTVWSDYECAHSYERDDVAAKQNFVRQNTATRRWTLVWDLGCNAGMYSAICAEHADYVVAVDGDRAAVDKLYCSRGDYKNILPLTMNLANMSPAQGWAGAEKESFVQRGHPDLVLCLALIHHLRISANIPLALILDWLRDLRAALIIEFVGRDDDMTQILLRDKSETYDDYNLSNFETEVGERFIVERTQTVKNGMRKLYFLHPRA